MSTVVFPRAGLHTKTAPYVVWIETKVTGRCDTIIRRMVLWGVTITLDSAVTTAAGSSSCCCAAAADAATGAAIRAAEAADSAVTTAAGSSFCFCFAAAAAAGAGAASPAKRARSAYRRFRQHTLHSILKRRGPLIRPSIFITAWDWHRPPTCILFGSAPISAGSLEEGFWPKSASIQSVRLWLTKYHISMSVKTLKMDTLHV